MKKVFRVVFDETADRYVTEKRILLFFWTTYLGKNNKRVLLSKLSLNAYIEARRYLRQYESTSKYNYDKGWRLVGWDKGTQQ